MAMLSAFNPHDMSERTVRTVATGRDGALREILAAVRSNLRAPTMQHLIVSAPRGYGKSFLMRHLQFDVTRAAREEGLSLAVVLMPEEMPHVKEPETLVRELTRALTGGAASEAELTWHEDDGAAWDGAVDELQEVIRDKVGPDGLVVALIENFDVLLRRAFPKEVQASRLRTLLSDRASRLMIVAASATGAFDRDYDDRLFHAFTEIALGPWFIDDCMAFFDRQRIEADKPPLDDAARARGRAVASFIGGTPRLATLLGDALFDDDVLRAADLLQKLVDELTPYYKERIEALPGRSQKLLDALMRGGEPATSSEVARRVQAKSQAAIAGPLSDLARERIVIGEKASNSAEVLYRVADRVFAHYYRRRILDHDAPTCSLEAMVDLLAQFFTPEEKRGKIVEFARLGRMPEARLMARLARVERGADARDRSFLHDLATRYIPRWIMPLASAVLAEDVQMVADAARCGDIDRASAIVDRKIGMATQSDRAVLLLIRAALDYDEQIDTGLAASEEAFALSKKIENPQIRLEAVLTWSWHLSRAERYDEAIAQAADAEAESDRFMLKIYQSRSLRYLAFNLGHFRRHDEAVNMARQAVDLANAAGDGREQAIGLLYAAFSLGQLRRYDEATIAAQQAADLARAASDTGSEAEGLGHAAFSLGQLGRHDEAVTTARKAADLARAAGEVSEEARCLRHAAFSLGQLGHHDEAAITARQAADLARTAGEVGEEAQCLRHAAFSLGALRRHDEAVTTARQAANLAHTIGDSDEESMCLVFAAFDLGQLNRHDEAAVVARQAATLAKIGGHTQSEAEALRLLGWELADLGAYTEALVAIADAARIPDKKSDNSDIDTLVPYTRRIARLAALSIFNFNIDQFHTLLTAAKEAFIEDGRQSICLTSFLKALIEQAVWKIETAEILDAWAVAIDLHFPGRFTAETGQLRAAAQYHASGRTRAALARLDPDFAQMLDIIFPVADEVPVKGRKAGKRRKR